MNNDLKQQLRQRPQPGSKDELSRGIRAVLHAIQPRPTGSGATLGPNRSATPHELSGIKLEINSTTFESLRVAFPATCTARRYLVGNTKW